MIELGQPVAHHDLPRHPDRRQRFPLERRRIGHGHLAIVQLHVENGARQKFDRGKTLVEGGRGLDLVHQRLRHRLAGFIMQRKAIEDFRREQPFLVHLAWIFDEIARHPGQCGIIDILQQKMDAMAEFVKQRIGIIEADQRRRLARALGEIIVVGCQRIGAPAQPFLRAICRHPCARTLAVAGEIIKIEDADIGIGLEIVDLEGAHIGIEHGQAAGVFAKAQIIELPRGPEHAIDQLVELEIGLHLGLVQIIFRLAHLFSVKAIVPRLDGEACAAALARFLVGNRLHVGHFFLHAGNRGRPHFHHQIHRLGGILGHRIGHAIMRVRRKAEQCRAFLPQLQDVGYGCIGIIAILVVAAIDEGAPHLFAQRPVGRILQHGLRRRTGVLDRKFARLPGCVRRGLERGDQPRLQPAQLGFTVHDGIFLLILQHLARKFGEFLGQRAVDRDQPLLLRRCQIRAIAHEIFIGPFHDAQLLRIQAERGPLVIHLFIALEQFGIEEQAVVKGAELRAPFLIKRIDAIVRLVGGLHPPQRQHAIHLLARQLHRHQHIIKGRRRRIVAHSVHIPGQIGHRLFKCARKQLRVQLVPGRHAAKGAIPFRG